MAENPFSIAKDPKWFESREKNPRVGIAISTIGTIPGPFLASFADVVRAATFAGVVVDVLVDSSKPLDLSRNLCVKLLLRNDPDYIFFMDSDMVFKPDTLMELLKQDKDIVSGVYCYKIPPFTPVLSLKDPERNRFLKIMTYPRDKLFKVDGCGCGCLLVKRKVFDEMEQPWFKMGMNVSEDMYFCMMAAKKGFDVWADGKVECGHISEFMPIMPKHFWQRRDKIKEDLGRLAEISVDGKAPAYVDYNGDTEDTK